MDDDARADARRRLEELAASVRHVAGDPHTRYRSTYLLDELFHNLVVLAAPDLFVEAGAYEADASLRVAAALPGCRVVAFEANPHNVEHFTAERDYAANGVEYRHLALADRPGEVTFQLMVGSSTREVDVVAGNNSLLRRTADSYLGDVEYEAVTVPASTLDKEFDETSGRSAMWLDVEGATGIVLTGASRFLDRCDVLKVEVETKESWAGQWQAEDVVVELATHGLRPVARDAQGDDQFNLLLLSEALCARSDVDASVSEHRQTSLRTLREPQGRLRRHPVVRRLARAVLRR